MVADDLPGARNIFVTSGPEQVESHAQKRQRQQQQQQQQQQHQQRRSDRKHSGSGEKVNHPLISAEGKRFLCEEAEPEKMSETNTVEKGLFDACST